MFTKLIYFLLLVIIHLSCLLNSESIHYHLLNVKQAKNFEMIMKCYQNILNEEPNEMHYLKLYVMNLWIKEFIKNELKRKIIQTSTREDWYLRQG
jgi:hypothetical protein